MDFAFFLFEILTIYAFLIFMLTRREVLNELKRIGVKDPSLLKIYLKDFEEYMERNYSLNIMKMGEDSRKNGKKTKKRGELWFSKRHSIF